MEESSEHEPQEETSQDIVKAEPGKKDARGKRHKYRGGWLFYFALALSIVIGVYGVPAVLNLTYYDSFDSIQFYSDTSGLTFSVGIHANGPMTAHKAIVPTSVVVQGYPRFDIDKITLEVWAVEYPIVCELDVNYSESQYVWEVWKDSCTGSTKFREAGLQNMSAYLTTDGDYQSINPWGQEGGVYILPKEVDDNWNFGRMSAVGIVLGAAFVAVPSMVKSFRDLYFGFGDQQGKKDSGN